MKELVAPIYANIFRPTSSSSRSSSSSSPKPKKDVSDSVSYASIRHRSKKKIERSFFCPLSNIYANLPFSSSSSSSVQSPVTTYENLKSCSPSLSESLSINVNKSPPNPIYVNLERRDGHDQQEHSNSNPLNTTEHAEINMVPNCRDKSDLYRTKMPCSISQWFPNSLFNTRHRRMSHAVRRHRPRGTIRTFAYPSSIRQRRSRQRVRSSKANKNEMNDREKSSRSVSNQVYNDVETLSDEFSNRFDQDQVYRQNNESSDDDRNDPRSHQRSSSSDSAEDRSIPPVETIIKPLKDSTRSAQGVTLGLARSDIDFIHTIIQRTPKTDQKCNRITALREAYVRARTNQPDKAGRIHLDRMNEAKRIRDELEKYDELPAHLREIYYDEDDDDDDADNGIQTDNNNRKYRLQQGPPSTLFRFVRFVSALKHRAQVNIQQWRNNFRTLRTRLSLETLPIPPPVDDQTARMYRQYLRHQQQQQQFIRTNSHSSQSQQYQYRPNHRTPNYNYNIANLYAHKQRPSHHQRPHRFER